MMSDINYTTLISSDRLFQHLDDHNWVVFDCRFVLSVPDAGYKNYLQGHIPGARYAHLNKDLSSPIKKNSGRHPLPLIDEFEEKLRAWGVDKHSQLVVYDDVAGAIAGRMWWLLRYLGHKNIAVLDGGFGKWCAEARPVTEKETVLTRVGNFSGQIHDSMQIKTEELERILRYKDTIVIDARSPERYSGKNETVDSEGGHITGSVNHSLQTNLDENACFLSADKLRDSYHGLYKPITVHSCGSGVTACHNLLAMELAGFSKTRLYVGSWSEWIRSRERPRSIGEEPG